MITVHEACEADEGKRLDLFVCHKYPEQSRSIIQYAIEENKIVVNDEYSKKNRIIKKGEIISVDESYFSQECYLNPEPQDVPFDVLWDDEYIAVINKPSGIVVHPGSGNKSGTIVNGLLYRFGTLSSCSSPERRGVVHRLDKNTSGVLIAAKNDAAHRAMSDMFANREIYKEYTGICIGKNPGPSGHLNGKIGRKPNDKIRFAITADGRDALTDFELISHTYGISVLKFVLHTGRTHQIRVHTSSAGFPIVKDDLYGGDRGRANVIPPHERELAQRVFGIFKRHALHARHIAFKHPFTHEECSFTAPYPEDFTAALALIEEYRA